MEGVSHTGIKGFEDVGLGGGANGTQLILENRFCIKKELMGIQISSWQIRNCVFDIVTMAPNFITTLQAAVLAGEHARTWEGTLAQRQFKENWMAFGVIGGGIGNIGMPSILLIITVVTNCAHALAVFPRHDYTRAHIVAEMANLHYLGKAIGFGACSKKRIMFIICFKGVKLWAKVSLTTITWDLSSDWQRGQGLFAVFLGFYAFLPAVKAVCITIMNKDQRILLRGAFGCLMLVVSLFFITMLIHIAGIAICKSRDFSVVRLLHGSDGCTPVAHEHD